MQLLSILTGISLILSLLLVPLCRALALRSKLVDEPDYGRKIHTRAVPRVGGVAIALAIAAAVLFGARLHPGPATTQFLDVWKILGLPAALIFLIGLTDDIFSVSARWKLAGQIVCASIAVAGGIQIHAVAGYMVPGWIGASISVAWLVACMNALNLIDGVDGLAGGVALFAGATLMTAALLSGQPGFAWAVAPMVGAVGGFLFYNFNPASIFLGDCGSLLLGFLLGCYGILWSGNSHTGMLAPLIMLALPLVDASIAILRRFLRRQPIFSPDRSHIHHRLLDKGLPVRAVALRLYSVSALAGVVALYVGAIASRAERLAVVLLVCGVAFGVSRLRYSEFEAAWRVLLGGFFRRTLNGHLAVESFRAGLAAATTPQECWTAVERASKEFGFHRVEMRIAGQSFNYQHGGSTRRSWHIRVSITDDDSVELYREFLRSRYSHSTEIADFAETIRKMLAYKTFEAVRPAHSDLDCASVIDEEHDWNQNQRQRQHV
jgi:UDP-GlcNAc:undecaprenyl-phosphate GlcNAc-1-phosphate transferase